MAGSGAALSTTPPPRRPRQKKQASFSFFFKYQNLIFSLTALTRPSLTHSLIHSPRHFLYSIASLHFFTPLFPSPPALLA